LSFGKTQISALIQRSKSLVRLQ